MPDVILPGKNANTPKVILPDANSVLIVGESPIALTELGIWIERTNDRVLLIRNIDDAALATSCKQARVNSAPRGGLIVFVSPERQLARTELQDACDEFERARPDCSFVYLTSDIDFAGHRASPWTVAIKSFEGGAWNWTLVPRSPALSTTQLLQILITNRPTLVVEAPEDGLSATILSACFPNHNIMPIGSGRRAVDVVHASQSLSVIQSSVHAIVQDRVAPWADVLSLPNGIFLTQIPLIANLLCVPEAIDALAAHQGIATTDVLPQLVSLVMREAANSIEAQAVERTRFQVSCYFASLQRPASTMDSPHELVTGLGGTDVAALLHANRSLLKTTLESGNYLHILQHFSIHDAVHAISARVGLRFSTYPELVGRLIVLQKADGFLSAFARYLPALT